MSDPNQRPTPGRLRDSIRAGTHDETVAYLDRLADADADTRKRILRAVREVADEDPTSLDGLAEPLAAFLTDEERAVRLTTAKTLVAVAEHDPDGVVPVVDTLAARLADETAFYYVRARCAEALGYVAVERPDAVADPATLADLRVGLSFDQREVREKLAKALAHVALGDPSRLRHQVASLADHLGDDADLVRYHLCTALVVIGCEYPERLDEAESALRDRLAAEEPDEDPYVRGRAAEALGLLAGSEAGLTSVPDLDVVPSDDDPPSFLTDRLGFCRSRRHGAPAGSSETAEASESSEPSESSTASVGTVASVREGTEAVVAEMTAPDGEECPSCGLTLPNGGPPTCPGCGAPR
ncbi:hypothetical protein RYH80_17190 [Halobaculum sp. MBLA0147]|uniref:hypothetical protein n=1 Tax=Halobaculum sp. MBLA0147 TaxID=3079934 RepID=UPI00352489BC